jgi:hypothetical protein
MVIISLKRKKLDQDRTNPGLTRQTVEGNNKFGCSNSQLKAQGLGYRQV